MHKKKTFSVKQYSPRIEIKEELIEIKIPKNTGSPKTKLQFPDNQNLRETHLLDMEVFHFADFPLSIVTKSTVISADLLKSIFVTLQGYNGKNFVWQDPAITYHTHSIVSERAAKVFAGQKINYPKCYIEIADSSLISVDEDQVLPVRIFYREFDKEEKKDREANFHNQS